MTLSDRQAEALEAIRAHFDTFGYAPTCAELGAALGISHASARNLMHRLAAAGAVRIAPRSPRALTILEPAAA